MDYEKKYNESLERASKLRVQNPFDTVSQMMEHIFPELKESEDERIRKELLNFCKNKAEKYPNDPNYKNISSWIAWLEKQGEKIEPNLQEEDYEWNAENKELKKIRQNIKVDDIIRALQEAGYEWSEETHQLKKSLKMVLNEIWKRRRKNNR